MASAPGGQLSCLRTAVTIEAVPPASGPTLSSPNSDRCGRPPAHAVMLSLVLVRDGPNTVANGQAKALPRQAARAA